MMKRLARVKERLIAAIADNPGIHGKQLTEIVYGLDPNGGPDSENCIRVHIAHLNKRLRAFRIVGDVAAGYRIVKI